MPPRPNLQRREQLLDEIEAMILSEGFAHLRAGTLAARLHCSRSTLYVLAPSKDELFAVAFKRYTDRAIDSAKAIADAEATCADKIVRFLEAVAAEQIRGTETFWRDVRDNPLAADVLSETRGRGYRILQEYLDLGIARGEFRAAHTGFISYLLWNMGITTRDPDVLARLGISMRESLLEISQLIVRGMRPDSPSD